MRRPGADFKPGSLNSQFDRMRLFLCLGPDLSILQHDHEHHSFSLDVSTCCYDFLPWAYRSFRQGIRFKDLW